MDSPSPVPSPAGFVVKNGLNSFSLASSGMPVPLSRILISTRSPRLLVVAVRGRFRFALRSGVDDPLPTIEPCSHRHAECGLRFPRQDNACLTRSGENGTRRIRTPVASKIALAIAAATGRIDGSPAPGDSVKWSAGRPMQCGFAGSHRILPRINLLVPRKIV